MFSIATTKSANPRQLDVAARGLPWAGRIAAQRPPHDYRASGWRDFGPAVLLLVVGIGALVAATLNPSGRDGRYAVIAPPWYDAGETLTLIQRAGGRIAAINAANGVVIAYSETPGFVGDLYRAGAWLVLDPVQLRGCGAQAASLSKSGAA